MQRWLRLLLGCAILVGVTSFLWFLIGATALFQRGMDIIGTSILMALGIPVLLLVAAFALMLIKRWTPDSRTDFFGACVLIVLATLISAALFQSVNPRESLKEKMTSDSLKITADGNYEYRIDLINLFQKNSKARLYLKDVRLGEEYHIPIDIHTRSIKGLSIDKETHWGILEPMNEPSRYILSTTTNLPLPEERFEIDVITKTSRKLDHKSE